MKLSRLGQLMEKFDRSGINDNEVISDKELKECSEKLEEQSDICADFGDKIASYFYLGKKYKVDRMISARE